MAETHDCVGTIREILADHARLHVQASALDREADLYQAGMTSHASVNVMLALEGRFGIEFPDHLLTRNAFRSIGAIERALGELLPA